VTLQRPDEKNAITGTMYNAMSDALGRSETDAAAVGATRAPIFSSARGCSAQQILSALLSRTCVSAAALVSPAQDTVAPHSAIFVDSAQEYSERFVFLELTFISGRPKEKRLALLAAPLWRERSAWLRDARWCRR
jgi:enoyl-CoA hydratase/carnithine racemase